MCSEKKYDDFFKNHIGLWSTGGDKIMSFEEVLEDLRNDYFKNERVRKHFESQFINDYVADPDKIFTVENLKAVIKEYGRLEEAYDDDGDIEGIDNDIHALLWFLSDGYQTADEWGEEDWIEEVFEDEYTTETGEKIVAFGYYGRG
jgi:hypothetical protein